MPGSRYRANPFRPALVGVTLLEPLSSVYSPPCCDGVADDSNTAGWYRRLHAAACLRVAGGRLSNDSGGHVLSRRKPGCDGDYSNGSARTPVWRVAGAQPDDLDQLWWQLGDRSAVQPESQ